MNILHAAKELNVDGRKVCLAIGFFDGVHLGHQQVIRQTLSDAEQHEALAVAVTFDRHPNTVVAPSRVPPLIYSLHQRLRVIGSMGISHLLQLHFDKLFSEKPGETFVRELARDLGEIHSLCVGADFTFGRQRSGNVAMLQSLGNELSFIVHGLSAVSLDGQVVSSTRIREAIRAGELDAAGQMLGRAYSLAGRVIEGDRLGRQFGFPTANLEVGGLVLPPNGVYAVHAAVGGTSHRAVLNIGQRPTLRHSEPQLRVEAHLLAFSGDLYGQEMELTFVEKLRDEKQFASIDDLKQQIAQDLAEAPSRF